MGIFSRFMDVVNSNINSILDKAEDPEKIVRLMIQEMEDTLVEVRSTRRRLAPSPSADALRNQHKALGDGLDKLNDDIVRFEEKLIDAKTRQQAILARQRTASRRLDARKRPHSARIDDAMIRFDQFERRIDDIEAHVESYDLGGKKGLKDEFTELETEDAVAKELHELKSKRAEQKRGGTSD